MRPNCWAGWPDGVKGMKARIVSNQTPVGQRAVLGEALPLATPYLVQVFPVYACNFKCNYCIFAVPKPERGYISDRKFMDVDLYRKCIDDLGAFPEPLRMLRFAGTGEPLLHPHLPDMIAYAAAAGVARSIDIVTNGALLTPELSRRLVDAGVSRIRVSIQGVNAGKYRQTTQIFDDHERIVDNVSYLHGIKGNVQIYVKIIDSALDSPEDEQTFYRQFGDIADMVAVEHLLPATPLLDYTRIRGGAAMDRTQNGALVARTNICPQPFYMLQINPDGIAVPCCAMESPVRLAQMADTPISAVWHGETLNVLRRLLLSGRRADNGVCAKCEQFRFAMFPEDVLDEYALPLLDAYAT